MGKRATWGKRGVSRRRQTLRNRQSFPVRGERLEDRRMLAAVVTAASAGAYSALADFIDDFVDIDQILPQQAQQRLASEGSGETLTYQAYASESNDVTISQQFGDFFYVINEGNSDIPVVPVPLAFNPEVLNDLGVGFSFVVEVTVEVGDVINLPGATAIVPNGTSILDVIPGVGGPDGVLAEMTNVLGAGLDFGLGEIVSFLGDGVEFIQDAINTAVGPIVSVVGDVVHTACKAIDAIPFVNPDCDDVSDFSESLLQGLADNLNPLPDIPTELLALGQSLIEGLTSTFTTESVVVSTLDGPDNIDLRTLRGVDQTVYAGSGSDTIRTGGSDGTIRVYGEEGRDTIIVNLGVDVPDYFVDGGSGNDILSILGSDGNDTIRLRTVDGKLEQVSLEAPNPNAGQTANEQQVIELPPGVTGGDFTLTFAGETTGPITAPGTAGDVEAALLGLSAFASGDVAVSGVGGGPYTVTFGGNFANQDVPLLISNGSGLEVDGGTMTVSTIREADITQGINQEQTITLPPLTSGGTFTLSFNGSTTQAIPFDAPATELLQQLNDLPTIPAGDVDVVGQPGGPWTVEFQGSFGGTNQALIGIDGTALEQRIAANVQTTQQAVRAINEQQQITIPPGVTGGSFRLQFDGDTTTPIPFDATVSQVQSAVHALSSIGNPGNIVVTGATGGPWFVDFVNDFRGRNQPLITAINDDLRGGVTLDVNELVQGSGTNEIHSITTNGATDGTFTLTFDNGSFARTTGPLFHDATAGEIQAALEALTSVGPGNVAVTGPVGGPWEVEYVADFAAQDQVLILLDGTNLSNGYVTVNPTTVETTPGNPDDEVQTVSFSPSGTLTGGTFTLSLDSTQTGLIETGPIAFDANGAAVDAALAAAGLPDVSVTGPAGGPYEITFEASLTATDIDDLFDVDGSRLSGNTAEVQNAVPGTNEQQQLNPSVSTTGGDFRLEFQGQTTPPLPFDATAGQVEAALEALSTIGADNVVVTGTAGGPWTVEFTRALAKINQPSLVTVAQNLAGALSVDVLETRVASSPDVNEIQQISLSPAPDNGGFFSLTFNGDTTPRISFPAAAATIEGHLEDLTTIGAGNVSVSGPSTGPWTVEFIGDLRTENRPTITVDTLDVVDNAGNVTSPGLVRTGLPASPTPPTIEQTQAASPTNELQRVALPFGVTGGDFTLSFQGDPTTPLDFDATRDEVQSALEALPSIDVGDVRVFGPQKGPWTVEFIGALSGLDQPKLVADGTNLEVAGGPVVLREGVKGNDGADNVVLATTTFQELINIEQIQIDAGGGDDTVIIEGETYDDPTTPGNEKIASILVEGGDGTDVLELISQANRPNFVAPVFPDGTQATLQMDSQSVQFAGVEGGLVFDAAGQPGDVTVSGTDEANEIRFRGTNNGAATFANDGQVTISLRGFERTPLATSTVTIAGEQGDDTISIAPQGISEFGQFTITGGGPAGTNAVRFEGTPDVGGAGGEDLFGYTPSADAATDGQATYDLGGENLTLDFFGFSDVAFLGLGGNDALQVLAPSVGSNDTVLFNPAVGNNGTFQFITQESEPASAVVYSPVSYQSIETRDFNTGTGVDTLSASSDDLPGVNSSASVVGGTGITTFTFGDQETTFTHDVDPLAPDRFTFEIGTADDVVTVTPGMGIEIDINTALGNDLLRYVADTDDVELDAYLSEISQGSLGKVRYTNAETVEILGDGASDLTVSGAPLENRYRYTPLTADGGRLDSDQAIAAFVFSAIGEFLLQGGASPRDLVTVAGSSGADRLFVNGPSRRVEAIDPAGNELQSVQLHSSIETVTLEGGEGDDVLRVIPAEGLFVQVDGSSPNASDRLLIEDRGPGNLVLHREAADGRSGSVTVGSLPPIDYVGTERIDIVPLDPTTGGTGADGLGRLVVFDADPFEHNESLPNRSDFPGLMEIPTNPNIDPGAAAAPFVAGPALPADEDWYRFDAANTATLRFELIFEPIGTLANGNAGLPGDGELQIDVYDPDNNLIPRFGGEGPTTHSVGVEGGETYSLRVRGLTPEAINHYDIRVVNLDAIGPQVTDLFITDDASTSEDESAYDLFDIKPIQGPTPLVHSLTIAIRDLSERFPGFLYEALNEGIASAVGQYRVVGDHNGIIPIESVEVLNDPVTVGQNATASIRLNFSEPLPDDRFTLTVSDNLIDPVGNQLDGESNASEPQENPLLPSGDSVSQGEFVARFTVDSRAEIGTWASGSAYVDTNGNFVWDPEAQFSDDTNEDIVYKLGFQTDNVFAGNFVTEPNGVADGFDKLAAYGQISGVFRWLIDTNNNGVPDLVVADPAQVNGRPFAGNFDGNLANGDEVGLKDGTRWHLDTDHDFAVDTILDSNLVGLPVVGDFDGDGSDDLGAWADDVFSLDLSGDGIDGQADIRFTFGFPGVREIPFAADFNGDGVDDLGLWNPDGNGVTPSDQGEWYVLMSQPVADSPLGAKTITFKGSEAFDTIRPHVRFLGDQLIPVDTSLQYTLSAETRSGDGTGGLYDPGNKQYFGFASYDVDQLQIEPLQVLKYANATDTRLAAPLQPGDTTVVLEDATGWANAAAGHQRSLAWYGYTNSDGYTYPDYTYTRNVASDLSQGLWAPGGIVGNVITLRQPWSGPVIEAGTAVRNATSGGTYNYNGLWYESVADQWTTIQGPIAGIGTAADQFRPGTAFIKPIVLANYHGAPTNQIFWRNFDLKTVDPPVIPVTDRVGPAVDGTSGNTVSFTPVPFGPDLYGHFGDSFGLPLVGNFDPPVVPGAGPATETVAVVGLQNTNRLNAHDVDQNGEVTPHDALRIINHLNRYGIGTAANPIKIEQDAIQKTFGPLLDVNGDGTVSSLDALKVVNFLHRNASIRVLTGEGEASAIAGVPPLDSDDYFADLDEPVADELTAAIAISPPFDRQGSEEVFVNWDVVDFLDGEENESSEDDALAETLTLLSSQRNG